MTTLFDIAGVQARIFHLPNRPPFMIAADLAEVYGTSVKALNQAVSRNPERFPEDFRFFLEADEIDPRWSQSVTTSGFRSDLKYPAFSHAGAYALSAVLKTETAAQVSVIVHRAFAAMEEQALADAQAMILKLRTEEARRKPLRVQVINGVNAGYSLNQIWRMGTASKPRLAQAIHECLALGLIDRLPDGMPFEQMALFQ